MILLTIPITNTMFRLMPTMAYIKILITTTKQGLNVMETWHYRDMAYIVEKRPKTSFFSKQNILPLVFKKAITTATYKIFFPNPSCVRQWLRKQIYVLHNRVKSSTNLQVVPLTHSKLFHRQQQKWLHPETSPCNSEIWTISMLLQQAHVEHNLQRTHSKFFHR